MNHTSPIIIQIAADFWKKAVGRNVSPYDIAGAVNLVLTLDLVYLPDLTLIKIQDWLTKRKVPFNPEIDDRPLHGFILVVRGSGFIFVNETDTEKEKRYTIAHEASHYLWDYKQLRDKAVKKLGETILDVIHGLREPTPEEKIDGLLTSVIIRPFMHLLEKSADGSYTSRQILDSENNADRLALELLAPCAEVIKDTNPDNNKISFKDFKDQSYQILRYRYLIPDAFAKTYSTRLANAVTGGPNLVSKLGF